MAARRVKPGSVAVAVTLAVVAAAATYTLKFAVRDLEIEIGRQRALLDREEMFLQTARTNLAYLTRPDRLVVQAASLGMVPGRGSQIVDPSQIVPASQLELARTPLVALLPSGAAAELRLRPLPGLAVAKRKSP